MPRKSDIRCVVLGSGGQARMVIDCLTQSRAARPVAAVDANAARWGTRVNGVPVVGDDAALAGLKRKGVRHFVTGVGGAGDNTLRRRLFESGIAQGFKPIGVAHPSAICAPGATLGAGVQQMPRSVINTGAVIGDNVIVNTGAIVEHDCVVADHAHVATGAVLCGGVNVGVGAHIGAGAVVRQGISIGAGALVAAGAVVVKDVRAGAMVAGIPAKPLRRTSRT